MNNKAKDRRSTGLVVVRKAKVMSFEDIEIAWVVRAVKDVIKSKGKRSQKRKSAALELDEPETDELGADEPEPQPEVARMVNAPVL